MKKVILFFPLLVLMSLWSCRENLDFQEVSIQDPVAQETIPVRINGTIEDGVQIISGASLSVYQDGNIIGDGLSDQEGRFSFTYYPTKTGTEPIDLQVKHDSYEDNLIRLQTPEQNTTNITMMERGTMASSRVDLSSAPDLVSLKGQVVDGEEEPLAYQFLFFTINDSLVNYTSTGRDGSFNLLIPANATGALFFFDRACRSTFLQQSVTTTDEDIDIGIIKNEGGTTSQFTVTGTVLDCDGNPLPQPVVTLINGRRDYAVFGDKNGQYEITIFNCSDDDDASDIRVIASGYAGTVLSQPFDTTITGEETALPPITICKSPSVGTTEVTLMIEGDTLLLTNPHQFTVGGPTGAQTSIAPIAEGTNSRASGLFLDIDGTTEGTFNVSLASITNGQYELSVAPSRYPETRGEASIETLNDQSIRGRLTLNMFDPANNANVVVTGTFSIRN